MSSDNTLERFNMLVVEDATRARDEILEQLDEDADLKVSLKKAEIDAVANTLYNKEISYSKHESDLEISKANANARRLLIKCRNEIMGEVIDGLRSKLMEFTLSNAYFDYLVGNIEAGLKYAGSGRTMIYVTPRDFEYGFDRLRRLAGRLSDSVEFAKGEEAMIGGCRIKNTEEDIFVDNSFEKKIELYSRELIKISGLKIE
ncbi:MAG: V-type ATP synthase subunit E [Oscillospiraceae bacterium]|nr:V-type ATP synthase subunit E [Oscillospiraceae bacterium]